MTWGTRLTDEERCALGERLDALGASRHGAPLTDADAAFVLAPIAAIVADAAARLAGARPEAVRVAGLPIDPLAPGAAPPTPTPRADVLLDAFTRALGRRPIAYAEASGGSIFQDVFPRPDALDKPHAHGAAAIGWHVDGAGYPHELVPDRMGLLGLRNDPRSPTLLARVDDVLATLPAEHARTLGAPAYRYRLPTADGRVERGRFTDWWPLVVARPGEAATGYFFPYVLPRTRAAAAAVAAFDHAATACAERVVVGPGQLLLWPNGTYVHARDALPTPAPGAMRWLKRTFGLSPTLHAAAALGADRIVRITPTLLADLRPRYRPAPARCVRSSIPPAASAGSAALDPA